MKIPESLKWKSTGVTLGGGGQGKVYQVIDKTKSDGVSYALKALANDRPQMAYERFNREIEAIKKLEHPNIIKIIEYCDTSADFKYYVMEYIAGAETLRTLIETGTNPYFRSVIRSLDLFVQLASVVSFCAGRGIIHRDISPANILVLSDGSIKVIDFGICQIEGDETITLTDEAVGAVNYRSPECDSGIEGQVSEKSDVYSAGKVLWTAVTGLKAFAREKPVFGTKSMEEVFADYPETWHLSPIFLKTIRANPDDRWSAHQAAAIGRQLKRVVESGRFPLALALKRCFNCGIGALYVCEKGHQLFSNPMPKEYVAVECEYCGRVFVANRKTIQDHLNERKNIE